MNPHAYKTLLTVRLLSAGIIRRAPTARPTPQPPRPAIVVNRDSRAASTLAVLASIARAADRLGMSPAELRRRRNREAYLKRKIRKSENSQKCERVLLKNAKYG